MKNNSKKCGFGLIEIMVSVAIFSVVMTIAVGSLMSMMEANRKARSSQLVMDNLNFAVEDMTRTIRLGTSYHCGSMGDIQIPEDCLSGDSVMSVEPAGGSPFSLNDQVTYRLNNGVIEKNSPALGFYYVPITSSIMVVENLIFYVTGASISDNKQPKVLMIISGYAKENERTISKFNIQTTVTQRVLDF